MASNPLAQSEPVPIPDGVTAIGDDAFSGCNNIIIIYKGEIYDYEHINDLYNVIRYDGDGMKIENGVLFDVSKEITSIGLPESITEIGKSAFYSCTSLENAYLPSKVTKISDGALSSCDSLEWYYIPDGVVEIGDRAFSGCRNLEGIDIPDSVQIIGKHTFSGCENLTSATYKGKTYRYGIIDVLYNKINW